MGIMQQSYIGCPGIHCSLSILIIFCIHLVNTLKLPNVGTCTQLKMSKTYLLSQKTGIFQVKFVDDPGMKIF